MCPCPSSPSQIAVTTLDELHTRSVKSPIHTCPEDTAEHAIRPQPDSSPSSYSPASPTSSAPPSRHSTSTSMSAIQSNAQPNSPSQHPTTTSISTNSNPSCVMLPEPALSSRCDPSPNVLSLPPDSGRVDTAPLSANRLQSITPSFSFPGASGSANTSDFVFPDSADSHCTLATTSSTESISATSQRTPNVYINGLPPHFSEQELFALTRPFGNIKSVRTFTRHVSEKPTGYGFVLFSNVESAQMCIEGLRKHRNLHPSFSKQQHRIPGTEYAQHNAQSTDLDQNTFKSRMEKLKDNASTNLYIEGLPLSIDTESLTTLTEPYKIKSSRFFKTKLSNPPRIIAFVRLETRTAAEEVIERLHGRMVRGLYDPGCRISVRFADSAEQRELRRTERTLKSGDQSPSRLTIAQAALLNLRGKDLQANDHNVGRGNHLRPSNSYMDNQAIFNPNSDSGLLPTSCSLPSKLCTYTESPLLRESDSSITSELNLLQVMQNMGYDDRSLDSTMRDLALDNEYLMAQQTQLRTLADAALLSPDPLSVTLARGHTQARNGFTPAEELILEAHARRLQLQAQLSQPSSIFESMHSLRKLSANSRSFSHAPQESHRASGLTGKPMFLRDTLPSISEDDFHAISQPSRSFVSASCEFQGLAAACPPNVPAATNAIFVRPHSRAVSIVPPPPDYDEPGKRPKGHQQRTERSTESKQIPCPSSLLTDRRPILSDESKLHLSLLQDSIRSNNVSIIRNINNSNTSIIPCENNAELQHTYMYSHGGVRSLPEENKGPRFRPPTAPHNYTKKSPPLGEQHSTAKEGSKSPIVISPALTYSSRTPSTLSPATPFFGSFAGSQDAFEVMTMENEDVTEKRLKARVTIK